MDVKCVVVPGFKAAHLTTVGTPELNSSPKAPAASTAAADTDNVQEGDQTTQDVPGAAEAPEMDGYGPISAEHVRLLRPSVLRQILVDDLTGRPVAVDDRTTTVKPDPAAIRAQVLTMLRPQVVTDRAEPRHDPSARLARLVDVRDVRCAGPGCGSTRNHRDHLTPYPVGPTAAWNLGLLSERCHQAKHAGWTVIRHPDGSLSWTSPLGRNYQRPPPHRPPPHLDPDMTPPPLRPPPVVAPPWDADNNSPLLPAELPPPAEPSAPALPDEPPF